MNARIFCSLIVLCLCLVISPVAKAQDASREFIEPTGWSIGFSTGLSDLWGDVGTQSIVDHYTNPKYFDKVAFLGGIYGRYAFSPAFAVRLSANVGALFATDAWNKEAAKKAKFQGDDAFQRYTRNQTAKDQIFESTVMMEISMLRFNYESKSAHRRGQPVLLAGIGIFHYNPQSTVGNTPNWVNTYQLSLEGQGFQGYGTFPAKYSLWQPCIPLGFAYRWDVGRHLNIGMEYIWRMTLTDYLDGVSGKYISYTDFTNHLPGTQPITAYNTMDKSYFSGLSAPATPGSLRGNPSNNDSYSTFTISIFWKIQSANHGWWH